LRTLENGTIQWVSDRARGETPFRRADTTHEVFFIRAALGMTAARSYFGALILRITSRASA